MMSCLFSRNLGLSLSTKSIDRALPKIYACCTLGQRRYRWWFCAAVTGLCSVSQQCRFRGTRKDGKILIRIPKGKTYSGERWGLFHPTPTTYTLFSPNSIL